MLVGVGAFGLGRLSALQDSKAPLVIKQGEQLAAPMAARAEVSAQAQSGPYVASKSGSKYYLSACSGAKNIKEENKVFFSSAAAAEAAGYEPAANCPGL